MTKEELIRSSLPELNWEDLGWCWRGTYFVTDIRLVKGALEFCSSRLSEEVLELFPSEIPEEDGYGNVKIELQKYSIDDINKFILGIKNWMSWIDSYKGSSEDIDERSTFSTFINWCDECSNGQLFVCDDVLSILGSDGPDITFEKLDDIPFNRPEAIDAFLKEEGYYKSKDVMFGSAHYTAPKVHYLEWFNKKFNR